jgi:acyl-CoA synthetase (AMP-forming)/AMP-acid ligase II
MQQTLQGRILDRIERQPSARVLGHLDAAGRPRWRTFEQLYAWGSEHGARLAELGLRPGDTCILVLPSDERCAGILTGAFLLGARPLLIAPPTIQAQGRYSSLARVLQHVAKKTKPRLVLAPASMAAMSDELRAGLARTTQIGFLDDGASSRQVAPSPPRSLLGSGTDIAALQLTSGTTGLPRVCVWSQQSVLAAVDCIAAALRLGAEDCIVNWTPLYHDLGLVGNFLLCTITGVPLLQLDPAAFVRRPAIWLRALSDSGATMTWSTNFGLGITTERASAEELDGVRLDRVKAVWLSAERIHPGTIESFHRRFADHGLSRAALKPAYGLAENIGGATFTDLDREAVVESLRERPLRERGVARLASGATGERTVEVVGVGRPAPGVEVRILSRLGRELAEGRVGEIALRSPSRMTGYLGDAPATRRALVGDLLRTGDLGYVRAGELFWVGRVRERINTLGRKLDPSDFERPLLQVAELRQGCFAAFGVDDPHSGTQRVVVVTEVLDPLERSGRQVIDDIQRQVFFELGLKLDDVVLVPRGTLVKTSSGKRRHRIFRDLYAGGDLDAVRLRVER